MEKKLTIRKDLLVMNREKRDEFYHQAENLYSLVRELDARYTEVTDGYIPTFSENPLTQELCLKMYLEGASMHGLRGFVKRIDSSSEDEWTKWIKSNGGVTDHV